MRFARLRSVRGLFLTFFFIFLTSGVLKIRSNCYHIKWPPLSCGLNKLRRPSFLIKFSLAPDTRRSATDPHKPISKSGRYFENWKELRQTVSD